jgi:hypothetical protein
VVRARDGGPFPWAVLYWFLGTVMSVGDLSGLRGPARPLPAHQVWTRDGKRFVVTPYRLAAEHDDANAVEVTPGKSLTTRGSCRIPWPVFRRFMEAVERSQEPRGP